MEQFVEVSYFVWRKRGQRAGKKWIYWKILHFPTETLHLLQAFCTSERCSAPLTTILHLQQTLRPTTDILHLIMTPGTSERSSNSNKHCAPLTYIRISDRNSSSLTDTVHLFSHQNLWQVLLQTLCTPLKLNISAPYSMSWFRKLSSSAVRNYNEYEKPTLKEYWLHPNFFKILARKSFCDLSSFEIP